jgi:hypothetical protein
MPATTTPKINLSEKLRDEIVKAFPAVELTEKKAYTRCHLGKLTLGYAYFSSNGGRPAVETTDHRGGWVYHRIHTAADVKKAVNAMRAVEKAAAKKVAKK